MSQNISCATDVDSKKALSSSMNKSIHCIGIGGIGVSALAKCYKTNGWNVSGSDLSSSLITKDLERHGIMIFIGQHSASHLPQETSLLVYSNAVKNDNPELLEAKKRGIGCISYPEAVGRLLESYKAIAIAGAHGKSTTTALMSLILVEGGLDPTVIVGTRLKEFNDSNYRLGKSNYFVVEADEWRAAFLNYHPWALLITSIDREHLDFYKNFGTIKKTYLTFISGMKDEGILVLNADDKGIISIKEKIEAIAEKKSLKVLWYSSKDTIASIIKENIQIPGDHNISNAIGAFTLATHVDVSQKNIIRALASFKGTWRRFEYKGILNGARVFDDYAHHPREIQATLQGAKTLVKNNGKVWCVFQPHQRERLALLFRDFVKSFKDADNVVFLPIYEVVGREEKDTTMNTERLYNEIKKKQSVYYVSDPRDLKGFLKDKVKENDILIMMGAGDVAKYTEELVR